MSFSEKIKKTVWKNAKTIPDFDPNIRRRDRYGRVMKYEQYGKRRLKYGWEIDHIVPVSRRGSDNLSNLQALHHDSNIKKSNK